MHPARPGILQQVPNFTAISVSEEPRVRTQLRLSIGDPVPPIANEWRGHNFTLRQPLPHRQSEPIGEAVGPNPDQLLLPCNYLADAFHSRSHAIGRFLQTRFDSEEISTFLARGDGC